MSENNGMPDDWKDMLRSIMGDEAAEQILGALESQGIDSSEQISKMINPATFGMISQQIQAMLGAAGDGPVNWKVAEQVARETIAHNHQDRMVGAEAEQARATLRMASLWLDVATEIDPTLGPNMAWTRLDWIAHSIPTFRKLIEPVGANIGRAFGESLGAQFEQLPEAMSQMLGGQSGVQNSIFEKMIATVLGVQYGTALSELAVVSFGSTDTGIPLIEGSSAALVPANIADFAKDLEVPLEEVQAYIAVRESAAARLFTRIGWLRPQLLDTVAAFARDIEIDTEAIEEQVRSIDMTSGQVPEIDLSGVFVSSLTESQVAALERLELLLSLIEGWVTEVTAQAVAAHLPHAVPLREMFTRRYATDNPGRNVWGRLIGLELQPRRLRESAKFWQLAQVRLGIDGRDRLWSHPDMLPQQTVLDDPESFFKTDVEATDLDSELESFLAGLFDDSPDGDVPHEPKYGEDPAAGGSGDGAPGGSPSDGGDSPQL